METLVAPQDWNVICTVREIPEEKIEFIHCFYEHGEKYRIGWSEVQRGGRFSYMVYKDSYRKLQASRDIKVGRKKLKRFDAQVSNVSMVVLIPT